MRMGLRIRLRGSVAELDMQRVLSDLGHLIKLLGLLEDAQLHKDRKPASRSTWAFNALGLGSLDAAITPLEARGGATFEVLDRIPELFLVGRAGAGDHVRADVLMSEDKGFP